MQFRWPTRAATNEAARTARISKGRYGSHYFCLRDAPKWHLARTLWERNQVLSLILRQTILVLATGLVVGAPAVLAAQRLITTQLYGLPAINPLSAAAILAGYLPDRQATNVDPMVALRYE